MGIRTGNPRGRPTGSKSRRTKEVEAATAEAAEHLESIIPGAFEGDAHALLMAVYKDPSKEWPIRIDAAKAAIRYEKPALATTTLKGDEDAPLAVVAVERRIVRPNTTDTDR